VSRVGRPAIVTALFLLLYTALVVPLGVGPLGSGASWVVMFVLYVLVAAELAARLTDGILALVLTPLPYARSLEPIDRRSVAVLMTVCDDASPRHLARLRALHEAGHDVFVLDDSRSPVRSPFDGVRIIRRDSRRGAKGGNLNHWLALFGREYRFCCVLDADSTMPLETLDEMSRAAAHPENASIGIFQAKIAAEVDAHTPLQARVSAIGSRARNRVFERVHSPCGLLLSGGHNQMIRIDALFDVGGFDTRFCGEDTALSLHFAARGCRVLLVDAWSYELEPATFERYARRTLRWARQTVELLGEKWEGAPLRLKVLLCRHFVTYLLPSIGTALMLASLWAPPLLTDRLAFLVGVASWKEGFGPWSLSLSVGLAALVADLWIRYRVIVAEEKMSKRLFVFSIAWGAASAAVLAVPLAVAIGASLLGGRVRFAPTNSDAPSRSARRLRVGLVVSACSVAGLFAAALVSQPGSVMLGVTGAGSLAVLLSPLLLFPWSRRRLDDKAEQLARLLPQSFD
jgi:hypothetical protein